MDDRFIYVFTTDDRDALLESGLFLLKEDLHSNIFIFENNDEAKFSLSGVNHVLNSQLNL